MCLLAAIIIFLYTHNMEADSISGLFGIWWDDEGVYLLAAKPGAIRPDTLLFWGPLAPELMTPLLHQLALATMTPTDPITVKRAIVVTVICADALMAWIAGHYHHNLKYGVICFVVTLLNPVLFFYARSGLTEGPQFLLFALSLVLVYQLYLAKHFSHSVTFACLNGAVVALLFFAKISAIAACAGLSVAMLMATISNTSISPQRRYCIIAAYILTGVLVITACFYFMVGTDLHYWWRSNIATQAAHRTSINPFRIIRIVVQRMPIMAHHLTLMPILGVYSLALLPLSRYPKRSFPHILCLMATVIILIESTFGDEIRRNVFSFDVLGFLAGFTVCDYIEHGVVFDFRRDSRFSKLCMVLIMMPVCARLF